jgi:cell division septation protein DedD
MGETQDREITLGTGKLLGIFFGLVFICAAFFSMGYLFGRGSAGPVADRRQASTMLAPPLTSASANTNSSGAGKPAAGGSKTIDAQTCPAGASNCGPGPNGPDSGLYSPVSAKDPATQPAAQVSPTPEATPAPASDGKSAATGSYMVQVAAVSKQEDADILVNALRKKQYPVFVVASLPGDSLFHVQVGPFSDAKEAEAMRSRLAGDGYNAIVKK